jgi:hypothetical protein
VTRSRATVMTLLCLINILYKKKKNESSQYLHPLSEGIGEVQTSEWMSSRGLEVHRVDSPKGSFLDLLS